jgi:hypothetical protein
MIPDRNVRNTHAQGIVVKDEVFLAILKTSAQCARSLTPLELPDVFSMSDAVEQSIAQSPALRQTRYNPLCRDHFMVWSGL